MPLLDEPDEGSTEQVRGFKSSLIVHHFYSISFSTNLDRSSPIRPKLRRVYFTSK